ncbi:MAG: hypothetical protein PHC28_16210, partial [Flavobacterium sp.]|uniref:hypothetical protein n=1 Tax=Flavobacterium sp. TaxID=239 RepID=UPI00262C417A
MENFFRSFVCLLLITFLLNATAFAQSNRGGSNSKIFATAQPTPNPQYLYYCSSEIAAPLSAITSGGGTL